MGKKEELKNQMQQQGRKIIPMAGMDGRMDDRQEMDNLLSKEIQDRLSKRQELNRQPDLQPGMQQPAEQIPQPGTQNAIPAAELLMGHVIDDTQASQAESRCREYKRSMQNLYDRVKANEEYYRQRYDYIKSSNDKKSMPERASAYLLNAVINKVADMMDNIPHPNILPREKSDEVTAKILSKVIPVILKRNKFTQTYYNCSLSKVKNGFSIYGTVWNPTVDNGLGDVEVRQIDLMNIVWQPGITDIQESKEIFVLKDYDNDVLASLYPDRIADFTGQSDLIQQYEDEDTLDKSDKSTVIDWYYKKTVKFEVMGQTYPKTILHYAKICNGKLLYASENDPDMQDGWYQDGRYPVVIDTLYPIKNSPVGFGLIDMMREPQEYIDKLDYAMIQNVLFNSRPRYWVKEGCSTNEEEFSDPYKMFAHYTGSETGLVKIETSELPSIYAQILSDKKEELKENTGNRDFSQGTTSGGVTAASAIAALQEASSKTSRTINILSYCAYEDLIGMVISRMQQFYTVARTFRVTQNNEQQYMQLGASELNPEGQINEKIGAVMGGRRPIYDIDISAEKASPYSRIANNELAKELFQMGAFNPALADQVVPAIEMMDFDKKDDILQQISKNQQLYIQNQQMQQLLKGLGPIIAQTTGDTQIADMFPPDDQQLQQPVARGSGSGKTLQTDALGKTTVQDKTSTAAQARQKANNAAAVNAGGTAR